jgi:formylglycine-generating enzyme required for sulfatase activity
MGMSRARKLLIEAFEHDIEKLEDDFKAVAQKKRRESNPQEQNNLQLHLNDIAKQIEKIEKELNELKQQEEEENRNTNSRQRATGFIEDIGNGVQLEMVAIPGGTFTMGSPATEKESYNRERPQHQVTLQPFFMGKFPVTQAQWRAVAALEQVNRELEPNPSYFKGENRPVERISWYDAKEFCDRLSRKTGKPYHLPSEAQWEYACRAGTTTPFHFGETITTDLANYRGSVSYSSGSKGIYREETTPVGSFGVANAFGLYDTHGNVWEWCADHWHSNYEGAPTNGSAWLVDNDNHPRLLRGGSWYVAPDNCRSAYRYYDYPDSRYNGIGFRVVCAGAVARTL